MPGDTKEPQSYGSEGDWVSGKTGQRTNSPKATPPAEQSDFYDGRQEELDTRSHQPAFLTSSSAISRARQNTLPMNAPLFRSHRKTREPGVRATSRLATTPASKSARATILGLDATHPRRDPPRSRHSARTSQPSGMNDSARCEASCRLPEETRRNAACRAPETARSAGC